MELSDFNHHAHIEGTTLFDGEMAMKGYALNKMCYSFNTASAREEYIADPEAYYDKFGLNDEQKQACRDKNVLAMIAAGRQHLLPRQVRRHLQTRCAGRRCPADRHDQGGIQGKPQKGRETEHGYNYWRTDHSHIPAVGNAIERGLSDEPYWKPFFDGYPPIREWLADHKPDVVINIYNDHGLGFFLDKMPTFAIGAAHEYRNEDEGWGIPQLATFPRRSEAVLAYHREHGGRRVRHHLLPGTGGRPRFRRADAAVLARRAA